MEDTGQVCHTLLCPDVPCTACGWHSWLSPAAVESCSKQQHAGLAGPCLCCMLSCADYLWQQRSDLQAGHFELLLWHSCEFCIWEHCRCTCTACTASSWQGSSLWGLRPPRRASWTASSMATAWSPSQVLPAYSSTLQSKVSWPTCQQLATAESARKPGSTIASTARRCTPLYVLSCSWPTCQQLATQQSRSTNAHRAACNFRQRSPQQCFLAFFQAQAV